MNIVALLEILVKAERIIGSRRKLQNFLTNPKDLVGNINFHIDFW